MAAGFKSVLCGLVLLYFASFAFAGGNDSLTSCPTINESGDYRMIGNLTGAPNDASPLGGGSSCVKIAASNVTFDCNGFNITNNGTGGTTFGILLNGSANNVTVKNCPGISGYIYGLLTTSSKNSFFTNNTAHDNSDGFYLDSSNNTTLRDNTAHDNTQDGFLLSSSNNNTLTNNTAYNNSIIGFDVISSMNNIFINNTAYNTGGFFFSSSPNTTLYGNIAYNNTQDGFFFGSSSNNNTLTNNTAYNNVWYGFSLSFSSRNNLTNNTAYNNNVGFRLDSGSNNNLTGNTAHNNTNGVYVISGPNNTFNNEHYYNNTADFQITASGSAITVNLNNAIFDNPYGNYANFTNLSLSTSVADSTGFSIAWSNRTNAFSFAHKSVSITPTSGSPSIDSITWNWMQSEVGSLSESGFGLWKYNGTWNPMNNTPDTSANTLSMSSLNSFGDFNILATDCPVIASSGTYQMLVNLTGAPNDASPLVGTACVKIAVSNVVFDCNGFNVTNNGTAGTTYGVLLNSSVSNVTVKNCPGISGYSYGIYAYQSSGNTLTNNTAYNNSKVGFNLVSSSGNVIANSTAHDNGLFNVSNTDGFRMDSSAYNNLTNNIACNNSNTGFRSDFSDNNILANNTACNQSYSGFRFSNSSDNVLANNSAYASNLYGFTFYYASNNNVIANNTATLAHNGFDLTDDANNNTLTGNLAQNATAGFYLQGTRDNRLINDTEQYSSYGFYVSSSSGCVVANSSASVNANAGFSFYNSSNGTIAGSAARNSGLGVWLASGSNNNNVTDNTACNGTIGLLAIASNNNNVTGNTACNNSLYGVYLYLSSGNIVANSTSYANTYGVYIVSSPGNALSDNLAYLNLFSGIIVNSSSNVSLANNTAYGNPYGVYINGSNVTLSAEHYFNNSADFFIRSLSTANLSAVIFDNPYGNYEDFTSLSVDDAVEAGASYSITWSSSPAAPPDSYPAAFANKFVNISASSGTPSIDSIVWGWDSSESAGYNESGLSLWKSNASGWSMSNGTPDTDANTLSLSNANAFGTYGILYDAMPPAIQFTAPADNSSAMVSRNFVQINVSASDSGTGLNNITVYLYNSTGLYNSTSATASPLFINWTGLPDGAYSINATAYDNANNSNDTETRNFTIDTANPAIQFVSPTTNTSLIQAQNYIYANVNATDANINATTIYLYNSSGLYDSLSRQSWCYQESADVSTACGGLDTGSYGFGGTGWSGGTTALYDGDWDTSSRAGGMFGGTSYMYIDYAKPSDALPSSLWQVKKDVEFSANESNYSIPSDCFAQDPLQFRITSFGDAFGDTWADLDCYNGTDYNSIYHHSFSTFDGNEVWEEAMWWNIGTNANFTGLPDGRYWWNATVTDLAGNFNKTETRSVTIDTVAPSVTLVPPTPQNGSIINRQNAAINVTVSKNASQCTLFVLNSSLLTSNIWDNVRHLGITGGAFDYNASIGVNNYSSFNMMSRNPIAAGSLHTCYLLSNGNSTCYGDDRFGQSTDYDGGDAIAAAAGYYHTCYVLSNGNSTCYGISGLRTTNYTGGDAISVSAGYDSTCYLLSNGNSTCYSLNIYNQSINYTGGDAIEVAVGTDFTCYLLSSGNSVCYGSNAHNQSTNYTGGDAIAVSAGDTHACYLLSNGNSACYGRYYNDAAYVPMPNYTGGNAIAVSSGTSHACYLLSNGTSVCYGENLLSQATNYTDGGAIAVSAGAFHTCYLLSNGKSICYGDNAFGQSANHVGGELMMPFVDERSSPGLSSYAMLVNNADNGTTANATLPTLSDGSYSFFVNCTDNGGNLNSTETRNITLDTEAPMVLLTSPVGSIYSNMFMLISMASDLNLDSCWYSLDNGTGVGLSNCSSRITLASSYSSHCIAVYANDTAGNVNSTGSCFALVNSHVSGPIWPQQSENMTLHLSASVACAQDGTGGVTVKATSSKSASAPVLASVPNIDGTYGYPVDSVAFTISGVGTFYTDLDGQATVTGLPKGTFTVSGTKDGYDSAQTSFSVPCQNATAPPNTTSNQSGETTPTTGGVKPPPGGGVTEHPQQGNLSQVNVSLKPSNVTQNATAQPGQNQTAQPGQNATVEMGGRASSAADIVLQAMGTIISASRSPAVMASIVLAIGIGWYVFKIRKMGQAPRR